MPNIFDKALFKTPSYSMFDQSESNKLTFAIGENVPVYYQELYAGDEIDIKLSQLTRFMPMLAPVMHRFAIDFIPAFVPFRLLHDSGWWNSEEFFNPATADSDRPAIPMVSVEQLYTGISKVIGSVWDYLRYPTFVWILQRLQNNKYEISYGTGANKVVISYETLFAWPAGNDHSPYNVEIDSNPSINASVNGLHYYFLSKMVSEGIIPAGASFNTEDEFWDLIYQSLGIKYDQAVNEYVNYLHICCIAAWCASNTASGTASLSLIPWLCYRQLMDDWFKNTNIQDVDTINANIGLLVADLISGTSFSGYGDFGVNEFMDSNGVYNANCDRALWASDYFTSAFNSPQAGQASVPIPVGGTIPDLRNASRLQKSLEKTLYAGKRLIDQIFVHRGVKSSDMRMHRSEILGHKIFNLQVDDVLQTSQSSIDSTLADFAGYGASAGGDHLCHYRAEEGGLIMVIARVRPRVEYIDATPKLLLKSDFYDFENPDFDNVGMQPVLVNEIQFQGFGLTRVFGWQRKYAEYMFGLDHCHADFKTSMSYWHAARQIDSQPALNEEFITFNPDLDDYNRIFAVPGCPRPVMSYLRFDVKVSRPLSRFVQFSF